MSQRFKQFDEAYKSLLTSLIAFSSSGIGALLLIATRKDGFDTSKCLYRLSLMGFAGAILILLIAATYVLYIHSNEGISGDQPSYRNINKKKFWSFGFSLIAFLIGFLCLISLAWSI